MVSICKLTNDWWPNASRHISNIELTYALFLHKKVASEGYTMIRKTKTLCIFKYSLIFLHTLSTEVLNVFYGAICVAPVKSLQGNISCIADAWSSTVACSFLTNGSVSFAVYCISLNTLSFSSVFRKDSDGNMLVKNFHDYLWRHLTLRAIGCRLPAFYGERKRNMEVLADRTRCHCLFTNFVLFCVWQIYHDSRVYHIFFWKNLMVFF